MDLGNRHTTPNRFRGTPSKGIRGVRVEKEKEEKRNCSHTSRFLKGVNRGSHTHPDMGSGGTLPTWAHFPNQGRLAPPVYVSPTQDVNVCD